MREITILLLCISLTATAYADGRKYKIDNQQEKETTKKALLAQLAPLIILREIGMPHEEAKLFFETYHNSAMIEGHKAQVDYNYRHAQQVLAALPSQYRDEFMRLTYQWVGPSALLREEVAETVGLTLEQKKKLQEVFFEFSERFVPANRSDFSCQMTPEDRRDYRIRSKEIRNDGDRELLGVLTPDQVDKWDQLLGAPSPSLEWFRNSCDQPRLKEDTKPNNRLQAIDAKASKPDP